jgi:cold shock CspA family protein
MNEVFDGIVKWFGSKGEAFGYIHRFKQADGQSGEIFVHFRNISPENQENPKFKVLKKGDRVQFSIGPGYPNANHGTQAINVVLLKEPNGNGAGNAGSPGVLPEA